MMRKIYTISLIVMLGCCWGSTAFAKTVSGRVTAINAAAGNLQVEAMNRTTKSPENVSIALNPLTIYSGVASAAEIQAGDQVWVETTSNDGPFTADSVKVSKG